MNSGGHLMISVTVEQVQSIVGTYVGHPHQLRGRRAWKTLGRR